MADEDRQDKDENLSGDNQADYDFRGDFPETDVEGIYASFRELQEKTKDMKWL